jgi:hypothetical protein
MQPWISLANVIGELFVLAAAVTDLAAARARARRDRPKRCRGSSPKKAITARYHVHGSSVSRATPGRPPPALAARDAVLGAEGKASRTQHRSSG